MMNKPSINIRQIAFSCPLELLARIRRFGVIHKLTVNDSIRLILSHGLDTVHLTPGDYEFIAAQIRINKERRAAK